MRNRQTDKKFKFLHILVSSRWCAYAANQHDVERSQTSRIYTLRAYGFSSSVLLGAFFSEAKLMLYHLCSIFNMPKEN